MTKAVMVNQSVLEWHSRLKKNARLGQKFSEVGTGIVAGAEAEAKKKSVDLKTLSPDPDGPYFDLEVYLGLTELGVEMSPDFLILPFTPIGSQKERKFLNILNSFNGKIIAVNVPPNQEAIRRLGDRFIGYSGMVEDRAGEMIAEQLLLSRGMMPTPIFVLEHERIKEHYALALRFEGIKRIAERYHCKVESIYVGTENQQVFLPTDEKCYIIYLGIRGYEAALTINPDQILGLAGVDLDEKIYKALFNPDSKLKCTVIQHPPDQGASAVNMIFEPPAVWGGCGPTPIESCNALVFFK